MQLRWAWPALMAAFAMTGCNAPGQETGTTHAVAPRTEPATPPSDACVELALRDAGRPIRLARGQRLRVNLSASPATGYDWSLVDAAPALLGIETDPVTAVADTSGGTASRAWSFRAQRRGMGTLRFAYRRPWEADSRGAEADSAHVATFHLVID